MVADSARSGTIFHTCMSGQRTDICAVSDTGTGPVRKVTRDGRSHAPTVSREGRRIAFQRREGVVVATVRGRVLRTIDRQASPGVSRPVISPDGRRVAWSEVAISRFPVTEAIPYICVAPATDSSDPVCDSSFTTHVAWSAAGRLVGAADPGAAVLCELDTARRPIGESFHDSCARPGILGNTPPAWPGPRPSFSRDGRFAVAGLAPDAASPDSAIVLHDARSGCPRCGARRRPARPGSGAVARRTAGGAFTRGRAIVVVPAAGGPPRRVVAREDAPRSFYVAAAEQQCVHRRLARRSGKGTIPSAAEHFNYLNELLYRVQISKAFRCRRNGLVA